MIPYIDIHTHSAVSYPSVITILAEGAHPWTAEAPAAPILYKEELEAIGEIGLDGACGVEITKQRELFIRELEAAVSFNLPVVIHSVRSFEAVMKILRGYPTLPAVIFHGFIGSAEQAQRAIELGYYLSFGERTRLSPRSCEALRSTPAAQLFMETDEGEMSIEEIYQMVGEMRGESVEELKEITYNNYKKIFR